MMEKVKDVEEYIANETVWESELRQLVGILRQANLEETVKWNAPCYTAYGQNVIGVVAFKSYFGLWFHQGVFLEDSESVLMNANKEKTKALRQWRMTSSAEIKPAIIEAYVQEAIELAKKGITFKHEEKKLIVPTELADALDKNDVAKTAFESLRPGIQREYADWISSAKRTDTKLRRVAKAIPMIEKRVGLNDKYRT